MLWGGRGGGHMRPLIQPTRALFLFSPPHGPSLPLPTRVCSDSLAQLVLVPEKGKPAGALGSGVAQGGVEGR